MGGDTRRTFGLGDAQVVGVESQIARKRTQFEGRHRGLQTDRAGDIFKMHIPKKFSGLRNPSFDIGNGEVV